MIAYSSRMMRLGQGLGIFSQINNGILDILKFPIIIYFPMEEYGGSVQWVFIGLNSLIWGAAFLCLILGWRKILKLKSSE
jgi:hypothetical protein